MLHMSSHPLELDGHAFLDRAIDGSSIGVHGCLQCCCVVLEDGWSFSRMVGR